MQVLGSGVYYTIFNPSEANETSWHSLHVYDKYKNQVPTLCFRYLNRPAFIMRDVEDTSSVFLYNETIDGLQEYNFKMNYDLMSYDCVFDLVFVYDSDYLYKLDTTVFVKAILANSDKIVLTEPVIISVFENWTDMITIENRVYFLDGKEMYEVVSGREHLLGFYDSDRFNHTLVPTFEHVDGIRSFENFEAAESLVLTQLKSGDFMLRTAHRKIDPPTTTELAIVKPTAEENKVVNIRFEDVRRANAFPKIFVNETNLNPYLLILGIVCIVEFFFIAYLIRTYLCFVKRQRVVRS
jgi:hypothetical protein